MGKYSKFERQELTARPYRIHPIWRGIGCIMMILIPLLSYAGAEVLYDLNLQNGWLPVSRDLARAIFIPGLGNVPHLFGTLLITALLTILGFGIFVLFYSLVYRLIGPPRYGPLDEPPLRRSSRRR